MKKISLVIISCMLLCSCHPTSKEYFETAALNCNMLSRFGGYEIKECLMGTPQIYNADKKAMQPSTFQDFIKFKCLDYAVENYNKVKDLPVTSETNPMITASLQLYEFCISKYKNEYLQIAKMKDDNQPQTNIDAALKNFDGQYLEAFQKKYEDTWSEGLSYAKAHGIEVKTVQTSPSN